MSDENPKVRGDAMKNLRKELGYTQKEWAEVRGLSPRTVKREEKGESKPRDKGLLAMASVIGGATAASSAATFGALGLSLPLGPVGPLLIGLAAFIGFALHETGKNTGEGSQSDSTQERMIQRLWDLREEMILRLPIPRTVEERNKVEKGELRVEIDRVLLDKFQEEANLRGFTQSRLLESLLWLFLEMPPLSFQGPTATADDTSAGGLGSANEETGE